MITLTTAGLGDFVPTSDFNKVVCSIFIYFGVACIGLLLGSYIASMLDETSRRQARDNRLNSCPNCIRLQNIRDAAERRDLAALATSLRGHSLPFHYSENLDQHHHQEDLPSFPPPGAASERFERDNSPFSTGNKKIKRKHHGNTVAQLTIPKSHAPISQVQPRAKVQTPTTIPETEVVNLPDTHFFPEDSVPDISVTNNEVPFSQTNEKSTKTPDEHEHKTAHTERIPSNLNVVPPPPPPPPLGVINSYDRWKDTSPKSQQSPLLHTASSEVPTTPKQSPRTLEQADLLGSPLTKQILGRQSHTRHASIDINGGFSFQNIGIPMTMHERPMGQTPAISESTPFVPGTNNSDPQQRPPPLFSRQESSYSELGFSIDDSSVTTSDSFESRESDVYHMKRRVKTAKYVFLTLKEALVNSMVIIAVGCLGFWFVEGFTLVDSKSIFIVYNSILMSR